MVACLRITDLRPEVDPLDRLDRRDPWGIGLSPADEAALEHALRIADAWSGRLLAVAVGPGSHRAGAAAGSGAGCLGGAGPRR